MTEPPWSAEPDSGVRQADVRDAHDDGMMGGNDGMMASDGQWRWLRVMAGGVGEPRGWPEWEGEGRVLGPGVSAGEGGRDICQVISY